MWSYANTAICRENLALLEYFHFRAEGAKEYIKKFSKGILSRFIQEGDEKQAVEFVKTGFVSQNTLKEMMLSVFPGHAHQSAESSLHFWP